MSNTDKNSLTINEPFIITILRVLDGFSGFFLFWLLMNFGMAEPNPLEIYRTGLIIFVFILIFFHFHNIYRSFRFSTLRYEIRTIFSACFFLFIVLILEGYIIGTLGHLPKKWILSWMVLWPLSLVMMRIALRKLLRSIRVKGYNLKKAVIAGQSMAGMKLAEHIQNNSWTGTQILGFYDDNGSNGDKDISMHKVPYLGNIGSLIKYTENHEIDIIYVAMNGNDEASMLKLVKAVEHLSISIHYVPNVFFLDLVIGGEVIFFDQRPIIVLRNTPIQGLLGVIKRTMDIFLSLFVIVMGMPVFIAIAVFIKISSKGPVIFVQKRYGMNGEEIKIYKFRTMYDKIDAIGSSYVQATKNDSRITPLGAFLRRTSLDELPQFINVIQGRMSLVGPRPHPVAMNEQYRKVISGYMIRHKVRPGITGLAQVKGFRGETETLHKMEKRIECDLRYIREWSILFDVEILIRTLIVIFFQKNAY